MEHAETVSEREPLPLWLAWLAVSVVLVVALREAQLGVAASLGKLALPLVEVEGVLVALAEEVTEGEVLEDPPCMCGKHTS